MTNTEKLKILCVDDDPLVLAGLRRQLGRAFEVVTASSGSDALDLLEREGPFMAVISDMKMPQMDGSELLSIVRRQSPDTVRVLLTGQASLDSAIRAINEGEIFRFLTKPCVPQSLRKTLAAAVAQYQLVTAERELLESTLHGSVATLVDILAAVEPELFGRATRVRRHVSDLLSLLDSAGAWEIEVAALLSEIGFVTLPAEVIAKWSQGKPLSDEEAHMKEQAHSMTQHLLGNIPRLTTVCDIIADCETPFCKALRPEDQRAGECIPWGARVLKIVRDYECFTQRQGKQAALHTMAKHRALYDPKILRQFHQIHTRDKPAQGVLRLTIEELKPGMTLESDVETVAGGLLMPQGQQLSEIMIARLSNYKVGAGVMEPIEVRHSGTVTR